MSEIVNLKNYTLETRQRVCDFFQGQDVFLLTTTEESAESWLPADCLDEELELIDGEYFHNSYSYSTKGRLCFYNINCYISEDNFNKAMNEPKNDSLGAGNKEAE